MVSLLLLLLFVLGYALIVLENPLRIDKAASSLVLGCLMWLIWGTQIEPALFHHQISEHLAEAAGILFFLVGAMALVELIEINGGFEGIKSLIRTQNARKLLWIVALLTFFLSAILDNLTTTIVMITLVRKVVQELKMRWFFAGIIVIAANAGGAFSPIGDVTTTMLWIGGQISSAEIIHALFLPSLASLLLPLLWLHWSMGKQELITPRSESSHNFKYGPLFLALGMGSLLAVPLLKALFHLPPFAGILLGLGIVWFIADRLYKEEQQRKFHSLHAALARVDISSLLFFLGILLAIGVLAEAGHLSQLSTWLSQQIPSPLAQNALIGILSALVDNVPLVAASMRMYNLDQFPMDHAFWDLLAYCAGTGGSLLIIGSAAGVMAMGMEKIPFFWYLKRMSGLALLGYIGGLGAFVLQHGMP